MVGSSTEVATAVWVGNIVGDYRLSRYRNGTVLRHDIFRIVMQAANEQYGGEAFPAPPARLLQGTGISLPDITGLTVDEARVLLESLGLKLEVIGGSPTSRISLYQPEAGTFLARGMTVRVTATGPAGEAPRVDLAMPNLVGQSVVAAFQQMDSLGMTGSREPECNPGSPGDNPTDGTITGQSTPAGEIIPNFKRIILQVNCGVTPAPTEEEFLD
jgi:beta-lactam-binding protein with PASTA domain